MYAVGIVYAKLLCDQTHSDVESVNTNAGFEVQ